MDKSHYFYRCALLQREGEKVSLIDPFDQSIATELDPWFAMLVSLADGKHSLQELIHFIAERYPK